MADSIREQLIAAVTSAVGGVYSVPAPLDEQELPQTIVQDLDEDGQEVTYDQQNVELPIVVARAEMASSTDRAVMRTQANGMLADLIVAVFADEFYGGLADGVEYTGGSINTELGKFVFAEAQFTVRYHFVRGDPFTAD